MPPCPCVTHGCRLGWGWFSAFKGEGLLLENLKGAAGPILPEATWRKVGQMRKYLKSCCWKSDWLGWNKTSWCWHVHVYSVFSYFFSSLTGFISSLLVVSCFGPLAIGITPSSIDHGVGNWAMAPEKEQLTDGRPSKGLTFCWLNFAFLKIALPNSHWKLCHKHDDFSEEKGVSISCFFMFHRNYSCAVCTMSQHLGFC